MKILGWMASISIAASVFIYLGLTTPIQKRQEGPLRVVATTSFIGDWVRAVGGSDVELTVLVGPNGDPHSYTPTPKQARAVSQANFVFAHGFALESWLDRATSGSIAEVIKLNERSLTDVDRIIGVNCSSCQGNGDGHVHTPRDVVDPHTWLDPLLVREQVISIRNILMRHHPDAKVSILERTAAYVQQLDDLDDEILAYCQKIPSEERRFATAHHNWAYFARRYDFTIEGVVLNAHSTEAGAPSMQAFQALTEHLKTQGVRAMLADNTHDNRLASELAKDAGIELIDDLATGALGHPGSPTGTYLSMMRHNAKRLAEVLAP